MKLVDLLELIHDRNVVHTNFSPQEIFLKEKKMNQMQFLNLYHCAKDPSGPMGFKYVKEVEPNISKFDIRTRNISYISPEQVALGQDLKSLADFNNGKIDTKSNLIKEFTEINESKICKKNDYYSLGAILYKVLVGVTPTHKIAKQINE